MKPADMVFAFGMEAFCKLHPASEWPDWFKQSAVPCAQPISKTLWRYWITVPLDGPLGPNESWEGSGDHRKLIWTDPETGVMRVVISKGAAGQIEAFEAEVDLATLSVDIKRAEAPSALEIPTGLYLWDESE